MGASGWSYVTPYRGDLSATVAALHWDRVAGRRWTGRCVLLHDGGVATEVAIWGCSGD